MPSQDFHYNGNWHQWPVPKGVKAVTVRLSGGGSADAKSGLVTGRLTVKDTQTLWIGVGQGCQPNSGSNGGVAAGQAGNGGDSSAGAGGDSGGGKSIIRINGAGGTVKAVAGGSGGNSGDGGKGGKGGGPSGQSGFSGDDGGGSGVHNATGGTQSQPGNGGTSTSGEVYDGHDSTGRLGNGGNGGQHTSVGSHGGGGGGAGWYSGGGGAASKIGSTAGGGGGGGSNYTGGLTGAQSIQGGGSTSDGVVTLTWTSPPPANQPPTPPTAVKINNQDAVKALATKAQHRISVTAEVHDPDKDDVRLRMWISAHTNFAPHAVFTGDLVDTVDKDGNDKNARAEVVATGLSQNTHYYLRIWAVDGHGLASTNYTGTDFWTNRAPSAPTLTGPANNSTLDTSLSIPFTWTAKDPDPADPQAGFELRYRRAATATKPAGDWVVISRPNVAQSTWVSDPNTFKAATNYVWSVRTLDSGGLWGPWQVARSFFASGTQAPPELVSPTDDEAVFCDDDVVMRWRFKSLSGSTQKKADIRWRRVGDDDNAWITLFGDTTTPGGLQSWTLPPDTFGDKVHYEWQARTYRSTAEPPSDWSDSERFRSILTPGSEGGPPPVGEPAGTLGCGTYQVFIYDRGGQVQRAEITPLTSLQFSRVRDDISNCLLVTNGYGADCGVVLAGLHCWINELVVFRDGARVWEGPITRISYAAAGVEIEAKDVMGYVYRRIMRQGYNDAYQLVDNEQVGLPTVVERATRIIANALAPDDPNLLPYLTVFSHEDDAHESRVVADYAKTAWEEVDDLAANAGLDYTTVGRRIMLWDTHRPIGVVGEMSDEDFSESVVVTEYGMQLANYYAVTNNAGLWGAAHPKHEDVPFEAYGQVELLNSAYGESTGPVADPTGQAREEAIEAMTEQAERNIAHRWPTPVVVRVPDNSTLSPDSEITFDQLVPGVWIPLRTTSSLRPVEQWQKLDSVSVEFADGTESVHVVMSPAPNRGVVEDGSTDGTAPGALGAVF